MFKGKEGTAFASNSVFFPGAAQCNYGSIETITYGKGRYWSSTTYRDTGAYYLWFDATGTRVATNYTTARLEARSVRAVLAE